MNFVLHFVRGRDQHGSGRPSMRPLRDESQVLRPSALRNTVNDGLWPSPSRKAECMIRRQHNVSCTRSSLQDRIRGVCDDGDFRRPGRQTFGSPNFYIEPMSAKYGGTELSKGFLDSGVVRHRRRGHVPASSNVIMQNVLMSSHTLNV